MKRIPYYFLFILSVFILKVEGVKAQAYSIQYKNFVYTPKEGLGLYADSSRLNECLFLGQYYMLLQFNEIPDATTKLKIRALNILLEDYIPNKAYFAIVPGGVSPEALSQLGLRSIDNIPTTAKTDERLNLKTLPEYAVKEEGSIDVKVNYFSNIAKDEIVKLEQETGGKLVSVSDNFHTFILRIHPEFIATISAKPWIKRVEPVAANPTTSNNYGVALHRVNTLQSTFGGGAGLTGKGVGIGIYDGGIPDMHLDFANRVLYAKDYQSYHCTHVTGIIGGAGTIDPNAVGMAPKSVYYTWGYWGSVMDSVEIYYKKFGYYLTTNSWGYQSYPYGQYDNYSVELDAESWQRKHLLQVWAAHNYGPSFSTVCSGYNVGKDNICVGALHRDTIASFSGRGPTYDGRLKPDVCGSGEDVYSTYDGNIYEYLSGTSMSTPGTTGTLALLDERYKQLHSNKEPTAALMKAILCNTAFDMGKAGPDFIYGYGRIDGKNALRSIESQTYYEDSLVQNDTLIYNLKMPAKTTKTKVFLTWMDTAGSTSAKQVLVNNLDLVVIKPSGNLFRPWILDPAKPNVKATRGIDSINNSEQITLDTPGVGNYKILVIGKNIPKGPQPFALTWQIDSSYLQITSPVGGEKFNYRRQFLTGTKVNLDTNTMSINWNSEGTGQPFTIYFSADSGNIWIKVGVAPSFRRDAYYKIPDTFTTTGLIKITSGVFSTISDRPFTIMRTPRFSSIDACVNMAYMKWRPTQHAASYKILRFDSVSNSWKERIHTSDTSYTDTGLLANHSYWYSILALTKDSFESQRSIAVAVVATGNYCFYKNDAGILSIDSPFNYCGGSTQNIIVSLVDYGINNLTSATINWSVDGVLQTAYNWTGNLSQGSVQSVNIGNIKTGSSTSINLKVWTSNPNGVTDIFPTNDSCFKTAYMAFGGTYTIGTSGADYKSFNDAISDLNNYGVCAPTVFNVEDGTYQEQVTIKLIKGSSPTNTITFQSKSGDSSKVVLSLAASTASAANATLTLEGAMHIIFSKMSIQRTDAVNYSQGMVIELRNAANQNTISHCQLIGLKNPNNNGQYHVVYSSGYYYPSNYNTLENNYIKFGSGYSLYLATYNSKGNKILENTIDSFYGTGPLYAYYQNKFEYCNNTVTHMMGSKTEGTSLFNYCSDIKISGNKIFLANANNTFGIYVYYATGGTNLISNNFISISGTGNLYSAIFLSYANNTTVAFNSISINNNTSSAYGIYVSTYYGNGTGNSVLNNCVANFRGGQVAYIDKRAISNLDYNNWYRVSGTYLATVTDGSTTSMVKDLNSFKTATGMDKNSFGFVPGFTSQTDLHLQNSLLWQKGYYIQAIPQDIDGIVRPSSPTIGAAEYKLPDAGILSVDSPTHTFCEGSVKIQVTLKNYSEKTISNLTLNCMIDGVVQATTKWYGNLPAFDTISQVQTIPYYFSAGKHSVIFWSTFPNGSKDGNNLNDSVFTSFSTSTIPTSYAGKDTNICDGIKLKIGKLDSAGYSYYWESNPKGFYSNLSDPVVAPVVNTTYFLTVTDTLIGCFSKDSVSILLNPIPQINLAKPQTICKGTSIFLGGNSFSNLVYSWTSSPLGFTSNLANPSDNPDKNTTYIVSTTDTLTGCIKIDSVTIKVNQLPLTDAGKDQNICLGSIATIGTKAKTGFSYSWVSNPGGLSDTNAVVLVSPTVSTTYTLTQTDIQTGCTNSDNVSIVIYPNPGLGIIGRSNVCSRMVEYYSSTKSLKWYKWKVTGGDIISGDSTNEVYIKWLNVGKQKLFLKAATNNNCEDSIEYNVEVFPKADAGWTAKKSNMTVNFTPRVGGQIYQWYFGNGDSSNLSNPVYTYSKDSTYMIKLVASNAGGCIEEHDSLIKIKGVGVRESNSDFYSIKIVPNPFNSKTNVDFKISKTSFVKLDLFDATSRHVSNLTSKILAQGEYHYELNSSEFNLAAGTYFIRLQFDDIIIRKELILLKN